MSSSKPSRSFLCPYHVQIFVVSIPLYHVQIFLVSVSSPDLPHVYTMSCPVNRMTERETKKSRDCSAMRLLECWHSHWLDLLNTDNTHYGKIHSGFNLRTLPTQFFSWEHLFPTTTFLVSYTAVLQQF